jgi:IclR family acetate operon transcriptional repressor
MESNNELSLAHDSTAVEARADLSTVQSVDKALSIIELLMRHGTALSARDIATDTGINRTTAHRLINALMHRGWIEKEDGSSAYRASLRFLILANVAYQDRNVLEEIRPMLELLSAQSRETVHVGVLDGFEIVHVGKIDSPERVSVSSKIGTRAVPHLAALGKALLATSSPEMIDAYIKYAQRLPAPDTLTDPSWLRLEIMETLERGHSVDNEEDSIGVRCIGAAVRTGGGEPLFAISITGPSGRFTNERAEAFAPELIRAASSLSRQFGWQPAAAEIEASTAGTQ